MNDEITNVAGDSKAQVQKYVLGAVHVEYLAAAQ